MCVCDYIYIFSVCVSIYEYIYKCVESINVYIKITHSYACNHTEIHRERERERQTAKNRTMHTVGHLVWSRVCAKHWTYIKEPDRQGPQPHRKTNNEQVNSKQMKEYRFQALVEMNRRVCRGLQRQRDWLDPGRYKGVCPVEGPGKLELRSARFQSWLSPIILCCVGDTNLSGEVISTVGLVGTPLGVACTVLNLA